MKFCFFLLLTIALLSCNSTDAQTDVSGGTVIGAVDASVGLIQGPEKGPASAYLTLRMGSAVVAEEEKVCLPVEASGFKELVGFQYTMRFDSAALKFEEVRKLNLPGYGPNNFGDRFADRGYVSTLWTDNSLKGTTLADAHPLYEICFTNLMDAGESTNVKFQDGPTSFEVIDKNMSEFRLVYANGKVTSK